MSSPTSRRSSTRKDPAFVAERDLNCPEQERLNITRSSLKRQRDLESCSLISCTPRKRLRTSTSSRCKRIQSQVSKARPCSLQPPPQITPTCAITHTFLPEQGVEPRYIVSPTTNNDDLARLEFAWGMQYLSLNLHSSSNIINLSAQLHAGFVASAWALVPMDSRPCSAMVTRFHKTDRWRYIPPSEEGITKLYGDQKVFQYILLPLAHDGGLKRPLHILEPPGQELLPDHTTVFEYPYDGLPLISSTLQPHFVMYDLGRKLEALNQNLNDYFGGAYRPFRQRYPKFWSNLGISQMCYRAWMAEDPPAVFKETWGPVKPRPASSLSSRTHSKIGSQGRDERGCDASSDGFVDDGEVVPDDSISVVALEDSEVCEDGREGCYEESISVFEAKIKRWAADITPGPPSASLALEHGLHTKMFRRKDHGTALNADNTKKRRTESGLKQRRPFLNTLRASSYCSSLKPPSHCIFT